ncbi:MAG: S-layer homology domain-containing protein, partial [Clostridiales bacterium]|nr:S-layer homology domain-containing protein [Clostridiales bacterium]
VNNYSKLLDDTSSLISPLLATYLAYACERVQEEGKADTEKDALTIVLADFISYATDKEIDTNNYTAEDFFIDFLTFVFKEGNEEMADKLVSKIGELIPEGTARDMVASAFVNYVPDYKTGDPTPEFNVILSSVFKACVYGADPNSLAWDQADGIYRDPANVRGSVCFMLALGLTFTDAQYINLGQIISRPSAHSFGELVNELYPLIIDDNSTIAGYAESGLKDLLDYIFLDAIEKTKDIYGQEYYDDCVGHLDTIKANISQARQLLSYTLFYSEGKSFNTGDCIKSAASFLGNVSIVAPAHDSEIYLAWIRAINKENPDDHYIEHVLANKPTCTVDGNIEHWALHEKDEVTYYDDSKLTTLLAEEEIIDPKTGHTPGADVTILPGEESTCSENGYHFEVRYCEVCGEEASRTQVEDPLKQHTWGDWIEMTPATLDSEGEEVRTCSVCGKTETRKVPVLTPTPTATPTPTTSPEPTGVEPTTAPKPTGVEPTTNPEPTGAAPTATPTKAPAADPTAKPTAKPTSKPTPAHVNLTLNKTSATIVCGKNLTLKAKQSGSNDKIAWGTSNNKIAKVDSSGKVTAKMAGSVTVTAYAAGQKATCTVQVLYKDVTNSKDFWYKPTYYLTDKGVVKGYDKQTNFKPANNCTRAQMVAFIWRLMGEPAPKAKTCKFKDVKKTDYFYKACIWGNENHIVEGYKDGTFGPQIVCARRHAVTFLWRLAGKPVPKDAKNKFSDVKKSDYFYTATLWASETGILAGYSDGTFKPNGDCLRRQMVTFLYKYDKYINKKG